MISSGTNSLQVPHIYVNAVHPSVINMFLMINMPISRMPECFYTKAALSKPRNLMALEENSKN